MCVCVCFFFPFTPFAYVYRACACVPGMFSDGWPPLVVLLCAFGQVLDKLSWTKKKGELLLALGRHEDAEEIYRCVHLM